MRPRNQILIGVDGSAESDAGVRWGVREAAHRGAAVKIVHVCDSSLMYGRMTSAIGAVVDEDEFGRPMVDKALAEAATVDPQVPAHGAVLHGSPTGVLLDLTSEMDLVVIGTRGRGAISELLLGTVSHRLLAHADCPVVVVGSTAVDGRSESVARVVVAVGDPPHSETTMRFACREAQLHNVPLLAIRVYRLPDFPVTGGPSIPVHPSKGARREADLLADAVARCRADFQGLDAAGALRPGIPAEIFAELCAPSDLLVLGHHRHHRFVPPTLGPLDASILQTAPCPVVIVPENTDYNVPTESAQGTTASIGR